jgi:hypothetical protein
MRFNRYGVLSGVFVATALGIATTIPNLPVEEGLGKISGTLSAHTEYLKYSLSENALKFHASGTQTENAEGSVLADAVGPILQQ